MITNLLWRFFRLLLKIRYSIVTEGYNDIADNDERGVLFLPNHPALIDPIILSTVLFKRFTPQPVIDNEQANMPVMKHVIKRVNPIPIPDLRKDGRKSHSHVKEVIKTVADILNKGGNVMFYPSGRIYRSEKENIGTNSGVWQILRMAPDTRVVLVRSTGLWGSSFGRACGCQPDISKNLWCYLFSIITGIFLFVPKRKVELHFCESSELPVNAAKTELNNFLEEYYNCVPEEAQGNKVPYYWWKCLK